MAAPRSWDYYAHPGKTQSYDALRSRSFRGGSSSCDEECPLEPGEQALVSRAGRESDWGGDDAPQWEDPNTRCFGKPEFRHYFRLMGGSLAAFGLVASIAPRRDRACPQQNAQECALPSSREGKVLPVPSCLLIISLSFERRGSYGLKRMLSVIASFKTIEAASRPADSGLCERRI